MQTQQYGPSPDRRGAELAAAWVLRRTEVASATLGVRRPSQIEEIVGARDWSLTADDIAVIDDLLAARAGALARVRSRLHRGSMGPRH